MDFEGIMLSEIKSEKKKHCMISLVCEPKKLTKKQAHIYREQIGGYWVAELRGGWKGWRGGERNKKYKLSVIK